MEALIQIKRREGFTVLPNALLRDSRLSLKTKGLFCMMLSLPEDWSYTVSGLSSICGAGRDAVRSALRELEAAEYLIREQQHDRAGKFKGNLYVISEVSASPEPGANQPLTGFPSTGKPSAGKPLTENPPLQNKDYIYNTPYSPPEGDAPVTTSSTTSLAASAEDKPRQRRRSSPLRDGPVWQPERFAGFWKLYPVKKGKQAAIRAWDKLQPDDETIAAMGRALLRQIRSEEWRRDGGRYIPHPSTWINQARWTDETGGPAGDLPDGGDSSILRGEGVTYL